MANLSDNYKHIKGWGIDADPDNEPTYPMKHYTGDDRRHLNYERPELQPVNMEILKSNERPNISAVFGTSVPPSGLSGTIRRFAFKYSEDRMGHWLPLILADRINVVEGIIDDLKRGHFPNIFAEKGMKAEWKHNPKGAIKKIVITAVIASFIVSLLSSKDKTPKKLMRL